MKRRGSRRRIGMGVVTKAGFASSVKSIGREFVRAAVNAEIAEPRNKSALKINVERPSIKPPMASAQHEEE